MTQNCKNAIKKYGIQTCEKAYALYSTTGEGANTIGFGMGLTTRQTDAAINAGREIFNIQRKTY